jgi:hypothetical protein
MALFRVSLQRTTERGDVTWRRGHGLLPCCKAVGALQVGAGGKSPSSNCPPGGVAGDKRKSKGQATN